VTKMAPLLSMILAAASEPRSTALPTRSPYRVRMCRSARPSHIPRIRSLAPCCWLRNVVIPAKVAPRRVAPGGRIPALSFCPLTASSVKTTATEPRRPQAAYSKGRRSAPLPPTSARVINVVAARPTTVSALPRGQHPTFESRGRFHTGEHSAASWLHCWQPRDRDRR
jgi:hypothetical protein